MSRSNQRELERLARGIQRCHRCRLHRTRTHAVAGEGPADAEIVLIGEAPGAREDETGRPFVGRSGELLGELLDEATLRREEVFITSCVKCRPPKNRTPRRDELETCGQSWMTRQVDLLQPSLVVLLGRTAIRAVHAERGKLADLHGLLRESDRNARAPTQPADRKGCRFFLTYHPAAGVRSTRTRRALREDFRRLGRAIRC